MNLFTVACSVCYAILFTVPSNSFNTQTSNVRITQIPRTHNAIRDSSVYKRRTADNFFPLNAKKKAAANKFISEDLLSSFDSLDEVEKEEGAASIEPVKIEAKPKNDKKMNKLGLSGDFLATLEQEVGGEEDNNGVELSKKKKKDKKKKDKKQTSKMDVTVAEDSDSESSSDSLADEVIVAAVTKEEEEEEEEIAEVEEESQPARKQASSKIRFTESSQPGFVSMGLDKVSLMYGNDVILKDASFSVNTGERVGLVGPNGSGKSTQLKLLSGEVEPTTGEILMSSPNLRIAFLRQEFVDGLVLTRTLREELGASFVEEQKILSDLRDCEKELEEGDGDTTKMEATLDKMAKLQDTALAKGVYALESRVDKIMDSCGFAVEDGDNLVSSFSGGWKMRIGLAKILLLDPNILFLDEPTNHLDLDSVIWLEDFLIKQSIPMIIVSHDREFLDKVCNKIVDVEEGVTVSYTGNYSKFLESRSARLLEWKNKYEKQTKYVLEEEKWIKKANNDPALAQQANAKKAALEKFKAADEWVERPPKDKKFRFRFPPAPRCGENVLEAEGLGHGYGTGKYKTLFKDVEFSVQRMNRVGFVGPNGSGKSTLLKLVMGLEDPLHGFTEFGSQSVEPAYFAQNQADELDPFMTVLETMQEIAPMDFKTTEIRSLLSQFMFKGDEVDKKISVLSGGEKARVALCKMMLTPANLLLLDEPTNHLDISSKEVLEDAILSYGGSVLIVSHDRYFMSQVVNTIFEFGSQTVIRHDCDYYDYMQKDEDGLAGRVTERYVTGGGGKITNAKEVTAAMDDDSKKKKKNFGGSGVTCGNLHKGIKNAKRFAGNL